MARRATEMGGEEDYSEAEAQRRLEAALRGARIAQSTPMKDVPKRRNESKRKAAKSSASDA